MYNLKVHTRILQFSFPVIPEPPHSNMCGIAIKQCGSARLEFDDSDPYFERQLVRLSRLQKQRRQSRQSRSRTNSGEGLSTLVAIDTTTPVTLQDSAPLGASSAQSSENESGFYSRPTESTPGMYTRTVHVQYNERFDDN